MLRGRRRTVLVSLAALLAFPAAAGAAPAAVTLSACKHDALTIAGKVKLTESAARRARGATLQLRFQALPLFGLPRAGRWHTLGKRTSGSAAEAFHGLGADHWVGAMSWRFLKRRRPVVSGVERSQRVRVARTRGRAGCTIAEGLKPTDTTPPKQFILPGDGLWHRAPAAVQLSASDDFSGVRSVSYSLDGGPMTRLPNGSTFTITTEGTHTVAWEATDVAGNTASRTDSVKVDAAPPSKPALSKPPAVTQSATPTFQWAPATDSGSGIGAYAVTVLKGDGSQAMPRLVVGAGATSVTAPVTLNEGETYTAILTAVDNTAGTPWTTDAAALTFRVDGQANVASVLPAAASVLSGSAKEGSFTIMLDRAADPSSVSKTTVMLDRNVESGGDPSYSVGCANTACTAITLDPSAGLGEGLYSLSLDGVKARDEGLTFDVFSGRYSVPFLETNPADPGGSLCIADVNTQAVAPLNSPSEETGVLDFDWSYASGPGWQVTVSTTGAPIASGTAGNGHTHVTFRIPAGTSSITFTFTSRCSTGNSSTQFVVDNVVAARQP